MMMCRLEIKEIYIDEWWKIEKLEKIWNLQRLPIIPYYIQCYWKDLSLDR